MEAEKLLPMSGGYEICLAKNSIRLLHTSFMDGRLYTHFVPIVSRLIMISCWLNTLPGRNCCCAIFFSRTKEAKTASLM